MKAPPRLVLPGAVPDSGLLRIGGAELHHMRHVMRLGAGAAVTLLDGRGAAYAGRIRRLERDRALVEIGERIAPGPAAAIVLAAAVIKGPRMDFLVEKAAELGASALWPLLCARSLARAPGTERIARWRRLAVAAAKQSQAARLMEISEPREFHRLVKTVPARILPVICRIGAASLSATIRAKNPDGILIACGPEGDFDEAEVTAALNAGFVAAGLGPRRLRSETAALAALSIAACTLGEIAGGA